MCFLLQNIQTFTDLQQMVRNLGTRFEFQSQPHLRSEEYKTKRFQDKNNLHVKLKNITNLQYISFG